MGAAYYICVDRDDLEVSSDVNGKALSRVADELDEICEELELQLLNDFFGMSGDEIEDLLDRDIDFPDEQREATWFDPDEGISYFSRLVEHLKSHPDAIDDAEAVIEDLEDLLKVLNKAKAAGARWHLAIDI